MVPGVPKVPISQLGSIRMMQTRLKMLFRSKTAIQIELAMQMIRILKFRKLESRFQEVKTFNLS